MSDFHMFHIVIIEHTFYMLSPAAMYLYEVINNFIHLLTRSKVVIMFHIVIK
jgi:hypothetical protein